MKEIEKLVGEGFYMNTADFVRMSVREKLESIKVIDALRLDFDLVLSIVKGLIKGGRVK